MVGDEKLSWAKLKKIAENCDKKKSERDFYGKRKPDLPYKRPSEQGQVRDNFHVAFESNPEVIEFTSNAPKYRKRRPSSTDSNLDDDKICQFCKRTGHSFDKCWKRLKLCFRCGGNDHWRGSCPVQSGRQRDTYRAKRWQRTPPQQTEHLNE